MRDVICVSRIRIDQRARVRAGSGDSISVRGSVERIEGAELFVAGAFNTLAIRDRGGGVRAMMIGWQEDGAPLLTSLYAAGTRWLWLPLGRPLARAALRLALAVEALDVSDIARARAGGRWLDCVGCPLMVEIRPGWTIARDRFLPRLLAPGAPYLIALKAFDDAQWSACRATGACLPAGARGADGEATARLVGWLPSTGRRAYRLATSEERLAAAAALHGGANDGADLFATDGPRLASDDIRPARLEAKAEESFYAGDPGKTDLLLAPCAVRGEARASAARLAAALAGTGRWGRITFHGTPLVGFAAIEGVRIVHDAGHPETGEIGRLRADLAAAGVPPAMIAPAPNPAARTPWYLSLVVCPSASSGWTSASW